MYVALDANVLIKDLWLRSQPMRALLDFVNKTTWSILLHEVVETEVRAYAKREFKKNIQGVATKLDAAERRGVVGLPSLDSSLLLTRTLGEWNNNFEQIVHSDGANSILISDYVASEAMKRAAERVPPCNQAGEGMRDAMIWLGLLQAASPMDRYETISFISENTKDFAEASDKESLRKDLAAEVENRQIDIAYYSSLDAFLKEHAEPVEHITAKWIDEALDWAAIEAEVRRADPSLFQIISEWYRDCYGPAGPPDVTSVDTRVTDFYVWSFKDGQIGIELSVEVNAEAEIVCERTGVAPASSYGDEHYRERISQFQQRILPCRGEWEYDVSAVSNDDSLEIIDIGMVNEQPPVSDFSAASWFGQDWWNS